MSPFNPFIPGQGQIQTYNSKEIDAPKPNLSFGKLFEGIGETLQAGVKGATDLLDIKIGEDVSSKLKATEAESGSNITLDDAAALGKLKNKLEGGNLLSSSKEPEAPPVVQEGLTRLDRLTELYHAGKLSPTYYLTQQQVIAQQLKQRYPGSEKEIDQSIHRETSSANQIRSQVFADFQAAATAANSTTKAWEHWVDTNAPHLGPEGVREALSPRVMSNKLMQTELKARIAGITQSIEMDKTNHAKITLELAKNNLTSETALKAVTEGYQGIVNRTVSGANSELGPLQAQINEAIRTGNFTPEFKRAAEVTIRQIEQNLDGQRVKFDNEQRFQDTQGKPQSYSSLIPDKTRMDATWKNATAGLQHLKEAVVGDNAVLAKYHINDMESRVGKTASDILKTSPTSAVIAGFEKAVGGQGNLTSRLIMDNMNRSTTLDPVTKQPRSALNQLWIEVLNAQTAAAMSGRGNISEVTKPDGVTEQKPPPAVLEQTIKNTTEMIIAPDSPAQIKKNAVKYLTSDTEGKFFKELNKSDQLIAFGRLTTPQATDSIVKLGDPQLLSEWKSWATKVYSSMSSSRRGDIQTLMFNKSLDLQYDPKLNQLTYNPQQDVNYPELQTVVQLNNGLKNLENIYKQDGSDPSTQLYPLFKGMGIPLKQVEGAVKGNKSSAPAQKAGQGLTDESFATLEKIVQGVNPERFNEVQKQFPESKNIEDRRSKATVLWNELQATLKDYLGPSKSLTNFTTEDLRNIFRIKDQGK